MWLIDAPLQSSIYPSALFYIQNQLLWLPWNWKEMTMLMGGLEWIENIIFSQNSFSGIC